MDADAQAGVTGKEAKSENWIPSPFLDTLFDYEAFVKTGPIAQTPEGGGGRIAIIGAGAAGLVAGYELLRAGFDPVIFEASDRIGGRCYTIDMGDGALAEMGAMRVPRSHRTAWHYADAFGVKHQKFPDPGTVLTQLYYQNASLTWHPSDPPPGQFAEISKDFGLMMQPYMEAFYPAWQAGDLDKVRELWQMMLDRHGTESFRGAVLKGTVWSEEQVNAFGALGLGSGGFGPMFEIDFVSALRYVLEQHNVDLQLFSDGMQDFMERFATTDVPGPDGPRTLKSCIRFNCKVKELDHVDGKPVLVFADGSEEPFDAVIVAMSTRAADMMGLTMRTRSGVDLLPEPAKKTLRDLHMTMASKLFIKTETKFWKEDTTLPEVILTDELTRSLYCLDYPGTDKGVVLISYTWEDDAASVTALSPEDFFERSLAFLSRANPEFARHLVPEGDLLKIDWVSMPDYYGAFQLPQPGQEAMLAEAFHQYLTVKDPKTDSGVYLAGDGISWQGGWIEGALRTGLNAACAAAQRAGGTVRPCSPLDINPRQLLYGRY